MIYNVELFCQKSFKLFWLSSLAVDCLTHELRQLLRLYRDRPFASLSLMKLCLVQVLEQRLAPYVYPFEVPAAEKRPNQLEFVSIFAETKTYFAQCDCCGLSSDVCALAAILVAFFSTRVYSH